MSELKYVDRQKFEKLFGMSTGYVLDFSNATLREFVAQTTGKDIYDEKYNRFSGSKANRLRAFWEKESNFLIAKLNAELLELWKTLQKDEVDEVTKNLFNDCHKINSKLRDDSLTEHIDVIQSDNEDEDYKILARSIRESIEKNEPESALDRLHTFVVKYIRNLCIKHKIEFDKEKPLHSFFGEYVKFLKSEDLIESVMAERILKSSISILEAFNKVRNNQSFAHDNPILNYSESLLIFKNISSIIEFLGTIEEKIDLKQNPEPESNKDIIDDLPF